MDDTTELIIRLPSQSPHAHVTLIQEDGMQKQKDVSVEDLISHLAQNHQFSTGLLPQGTRIYRGTRSDYTIAIETPAKIRGLGIPRYDDRDRSMTETFQIPFPIVLFVFGVRSNRLTRTHVYCARNQIQREEDRLCYFPFGNVYREGHVCWGSATLPNVNSAMELIGVINMFFDSDYNGDLFDQNCYRQPSNYEEGEIRVEDLWSLARYLNGKQEYPSEMLATNNRTFQSVLGRDN